MNSHLLIKQALELRRLNHFDKAEEVLTTAIKLPMSISESFLTHEMRGLGRMVLRNPLGAIADFGVARQIRPSETRIYSHLGYAHFLVGNYAQSKEFYTQAIERAENPDAMTYVRRAEANFMLNEIQLATEDCNTAVFIDPQEGEAYYSRSLIQLRMGKFQKAQRDLTNARIRFQSLGVSDGCERVNRVMDEIKKRNHRDKHWISRSNQITQSMNPNLRDF